MDNFVVMIFIRSLTFRFDSLVGSINRLDPTDLKKWSGWVGPKVWVEIGAHCSALGTFVDVLVYSGHLNIQSVFQD